MLQKDERLSLYEQVANRIEGQIATGIYKKGDLLPSEKYYIEKLGVSRITIRKALAMLVEKGLIETSKGRGSIVLFDVKRKGENGEADCLMQKYREGFLESTQIRCMLEPEMARIAAKEATLEQIKRLEGSITDESSNDTFHIALAEILKNTELNKIVRELIELEEMNIPEGVVSFSKHEKSIHMLQGQHERILQAIKDGDEEFAYFYMKEHMRYVKQLYEEYFKNL